MSNQKYLFVMKTLAAIIVALVIVFVGLNGALLLRADAGGPTPSQPAVVKISQKTAHQAAKYVAREFLAEFLSPPYRSHVDRCTGGPKVWRCPARVTAADTKCRATILVWAGQVDAVYVEYKRLRCYEPTKEK